MSFQMYKLEEKGKDFGARFWQQKSMKSKEVEAGIDNPAPAVVDMAIYHFHNGVAEVKIGSGVYATLGEGQDYDTIFAGPRVRIRWRGKTRVTISVLMGTRACMEVYSPV